MKVVSWNINGIRSAENEFLSFMSEHQPDILMLQEVRAFPDQLSIFVQAIPGYDVIFHPAEKAGYSGTAIYYKSSLKPDRVTRLHEESLLDSEGRTLVLTHGKTHFINVYTPNGTSGQERLAFKSEYYAQLIDYIQRLLVNGDSVVLGGDLNIAHTEKDLYDPAGNTHHSGFLLAERSWMDKLIEIGMHDSFRMFQQDGGHYSWWHMRDPKRAANRGWRFDYFLISDDMKERVKGATILREVFGSDHAPIELEVEG